MNAGLAGGNTVAGVLASSLTSAAAACRSLTSAITSNG